MRDAEWIVRRVDHAPGGYQIVCDGVSELVRGREAVFLTTLEPTIQVLDPAETELVSDDSAQFTDSILYMESQLRQAVPNDTEIHVGHTAAMDCVDYQLDPARQALARPRQRALIADAVGLGKTLEAGVLVSELIARGRGRRILVLAVKSMLTQYQKEFWNRFTIPLTRLDSIGIQRVRSRIPTNHNPFYYYDKAIISIDTLKQDAEYRTYLEQTSWDIIVIDEAHNVADRGTASQRNRLARLLARRRGPPSQGHQGRHLLHPRRPCPPRDEHRPRLGGCPRHRIRHHPPQDHGQHPTRRPDSAPHRVRSSIHPVRPGTGLPCSVGRVHLEKCGDVSGAIPRDVTHSSNSVLWPDLDADEFVCLATRRYPRAI